MKPTNLLNTLIALVFLPFMLSAQSSSKSSLQGAWKIVEVTYIDQDTSTNTNPQPSLIMFGKDHYSVLNIAGEKPRALFKGEQPTTEEKVSVYDSFFANAGTYEVNGSTLTTHPSVAKNPNFMAGGSAKFQYNIKGNTLWMTSRGGDFLFLIDGKLRPLSGPSSETRLKLSRVE